MFAVDGGEQAVIFDRIRGVLPSTTGEGTHFLVPVLQLPNIMEVRTRPRSISSVTGTKGKLSFHGPILMDFTFLSKPHSVDQDFQKHLCLSVEPVVWCWILLHLGWEQTQFVSFVHFIAYPCLISTSIEVGTNEVLFFSFHPGNKVTDHIYQVWLWFCCQAEWQTQLPFYLVALNMWFAFQICRMLTWHCEFSPDPAQRSFQQFIRWESPEVSSI